MRIQHELGADIMFAFDELTTLLNSRGYRNRRWSARGGGPNVASPRTVSSPIRAPRSLISSSLG